jgi:hypothetical protein
MGYGNKINWGDEDQQAPRERLKSFAGFDGSWAEYCQYLHERGMLNPNIDQMTGNLRGNA